MTTLAAYAAFLTARWDEQAEWAQVALDRCAGLGETRSWRWVRTYGRGSSSFYDGCPDPRATLDDLAAKRAILAQVTMTPPMVTFEAREPMAPWFIVHLAYPFRTHPDHPANQETK